MAKSEKKRAVKPTGKLKVFILEDIPLLRQIIRKELESDFDIVGEAATLNNIEVALNKTRPNLLIADLNLGDITNLCVEPTFKLIDKITRNAVEYGNVRVVINSSLLSNQAFVYRAVRCGALGLVNVRQTPPIWRDILTSVNAMSCDSFLDLSATYTDQIAKFKKVKQTWQFYKRVMTCSDKETEQVLISAIQSDIWITEWLDMCKNKRKVLTRCGRGELAKDVATLMGCKEDNIRRIILNLIDRANTLYASMPLSSPATSGAPKAVKFTKITQVYHFVFSNGLLVPLT